MQFARNIPVALGISFISTVSTKAYTDIQSVSHFLSQLDLSQEAENRVAEILKGHDANSISNLTPEQKTSIACQINRIASDGTFYTSTPSAGYQDTIQSYW